MALKCYCVSILIITSVISCVSGKPEYDINKPRENTKRQEEFDGMTLPEISELPPVTQNTPAIVKIGQHYGIPFTQSLGKKKHKPDKKDDYFDHVVGASLMSGGSLISLGALALIIMATKALLLAFGAIVLTCMSSGWTSAWHKHVGQASTVYEVIAKPQVSLGHSYSSEVHHERIHEPYSPLPSLKDGGY